MNRGLRFLTIGFAVAGLLVADGSAFAQPKDKDQTPKGADAKASKAKKHKHLSGKEMVGDKIKKDGNHKIHDNGKFSASVTASKGKISGVKVKHADKGDVPVTKYKTTKKMAQGPTNGIYLASLAFAQDEYLGTVWIGYAYYDDYGYEVIYWFPYDMILDGDTGAIEYYEAY